MTLIFNIYVYTRFVFVPVYEFILNLKIKWMLSNLQKYAKVSAL